VPSMGVGAVPEIFGADGPKITQRPPRPRAHNCTIEKGQQGSYFEVQHHTGLTEPMPVSVFPRKYGGAQLTRAVETPR